MRRVRSTALASLLVLAAVSLALTAGLTGVAATQHGATAKQSAIGRPSPSACTFPVTRTDASGAAVTVDADPSRVVALAPSAAQTMWDVGARDEVVGMPVSQYTSYLDGYRRPTNVVSADGFSVDVETVVNLRPDLVLAPNVTPVATVQKLREAGLTVYHFRKARTLDDVYAKTLLTGRLTGNCEGASERVAWMKRRIGAVREAVKDEPRPSVVYPLGGGIVVGSNTFLDELIRAGGGRNLAAEAGVSGYGELNPEVVVERDPQWLVLNDALPRSALQMAAYNRTTAIRENQTIRVNPNYANQPGPRVVYPIETIARALHPEAMATVDETRTPAGSVTPSVSTATTPTVTTSSASPSTAPGTSAPGQPGFGLLASLLAMVVALLAATRRHR